MTYPPKSKTCLISNCGRPSNTRGLCIACYQTARKQIEANRVTWAKLEKLGLAKPAREVHTSPFMVALNSKTKK